MATKTKQWSIGVGSVTIEYGGQGDGSITITSDANNLYEARSMQITVKTTSGSPQKTKTITISQAAKVRTNISTAVVTASNQTYNGSAKTPTPTVKLNGETIPSTGYDVTYSNNTNAGTATITVTGKGDYTGTATGTFTIAQREVTLTWGTTSWTYDGTAHGTTCTAGNLVTGDSCTVTLTGNSITHKGNTIVTASSLSNSNYKLPSAKTKTISVFAKTITLTWGTISWTYDGSAHTTTCSATGLVGPDTCTVTLTGNSITNKGEATVTASLGNDDYTASNPTATLTINARPIKITASSASKTYDGTALTSNSATAETTGTNRGLASGHNMTSCTVTGSITAKGSTNNVASNAVIKTSGGTNVTSNYSITYVNGTLTVTAKALTITASAQSIVYGNSIAIGTGKVTASGLVSGDSLTAVTLSQSTTTVTSTGTITPSAATTTNGIGNYSVTYNIGVLTITARPINITAASASKVYDRAALTSNSATAEATGTNRGLVGGHSMTSCTVTGTITNAGTANNVPSAAVIKSGSTDVTSNYNITYVNGTLTVTKATPVLSTSPTYRTGLSYTGSAQNLLKDGAMKHSSSDTTTVAGTFTYDKGTNAGTYSNKKWYFTPTDTTNYNSTEGTVSGETSIAKASRSLNFSNSYMVLNTSSTDTNAATPNKGNGDGAITYSIANITYATINSSTGAVTSKTSDGSVTVTATIAEGTNYLSASASYTLYVFATTHNFEYTGAKQDIALPPGTYKFQVWGAQGGSNAANATYGITSKAGGKGGYSEGQLTIATKTDVEVYVGGQGSATAGGYNGGGSTTGTSQYYASNELGYTKMGGGGGATDIRLSSGTLLSRMIVAGGGSGGSAGIKRVTVPEITEVKIDQQNNLVNSDDYMVQTAAGSVGTYVEAGEKYRVTVSSSSLKFYRVKFMIQTPGGSPVNTNLHYQDFSEAYSLSFEFTVDSPLVNQSASYIRVGGTSKTKNSSAAVQVKLEKIVSEGSVTTTSKTQTGFAGGGTTSKGYSTTYCGRQNAAGYLGSFGAGGNQSVNTYRYVSGAGGGGWYGGGCNRSNSNINYILYSGGGSGFVNTSANASYRPSGYTGLQLDSGTTYDGTTSFPSTGSGNETGHAGNGYAKITRLS